MNFVKDTPVNRLLLDHCMSQTELAEKIAVERAHLCRVVNGTYKGRAFPTKFKIAQFFGRPINELFPDDAA